MNINENKLDKIILHVIIFKFFRHKLFNILFNLVVINKIGGKKINKIGGKKKRNIIPVISAWFNVHYIILDIIIIFNV